MNRHMLEELALCAAFPLTLFLSLLFVAIMFG